MAVYKGVEIDDVLVDLISHMHGVDSYRESLGRLQASWDTLALLGELSGSAAEMSGTRGAFEALSGRLLNHLGLETRKKILSDLRAKAQNSIDILVRNLFERTADIGFLAADTDVREFLSASEEDADRQSMEARFAEYVAKYSVYRDIVLFDTGGRIRARLTEHGCERSKHSLVHEALTTHAAYVEYFGAADFLPSGDHLVYAFRVTGLDGQPLGALALVFRLDDEMDGIFRNLISADDWTLLACVTADGRVIASSCSIQLPAGHRLPPNILAANGEIARLGGRQYIAMGCEPSAYQGYGGPGWRGLGLIPTDVAFEEDSDAQTENGHRNLIETVTQNPALFSDALREIPVQAAGIQSNLNRSVWNGSVRLTEVNAGNVTFAKTLLREIANAGSRTQSVFDQSIGNLQQTVIAAISHKAASRAAFAIDVMDRNLYERANDCRWWALDATFRRVLADPSEEGMRRCGEILAIINSLYTVYTNLLLFDSDRKIVAVSKADQAGLIGTTIDEPWVARTLALPTTQDYAVSEFMPTPLYGDAATYIYGAAVRALGGNLPVGGVGIIFDSTPQFAAMLTDALPRDERGAVMPGSFALFLDRGGRVIASSSEKFAIGAGSGLALNLDGLEPGESRTQILSHEGHLYTVGIALSSGYREYKVSDGYSADVISVCAAQLGREVAALPRRTAATEAIRSHHSGGDVMELATFYVGDYWFGLPSEAVMEAVDATGVTTATGGAGGVLVGYKTHRNVPIPVIDVRRVLGISSSHGAATHIVVAQAEGAVVGLLVDALGDIPEIQSDRVVALESLNWSERLPAAGIVRPETGDDPQASLLIILDMGRLSGFYGLDEAPRLIAAE